MTAARIDNGRPATVVLNVLDMAGNSTTCDPVTATLVAEVPDRHHLHQNYPNPFNPSPTIRFDVPEPGHVRLAFYDMLGRQVATLLEQHLEAGGYEITWDGEDERGQTLSAGPYVYRVTAGEYSAVRSMMLLNETLGACVAPLSDRITVLACSVTVRQCMGRCGSERRSSETEVSAASFEK